MYGDEKVVVEQRDGVVYAAPGSVTGAAKAEGCVRERAVSCRVEGPSFVLLSLDGFSITTNFSAMLACLNNIGPGFEVVGPMYNYSSFSPLAKIVLIFDMLLGRLEIFPILLLFTRRTWRKW